MDRTSILNQYRGICSDVLGELTTKLNKSFKSFLMETLILYLVIPGRINFLQLGDMASRVNSDSARTSQRILIGWSLTYPCLIRY